MDPSSITLLILGCAIVAFLSNRVALGVVAIGVSIALWATGVLDLTAALSGFSDPTVLFIAALFVVSEALDATGITTWASNVVLARAGGSRSKTLVLIAVLVAALTAFISVNGSVAALLPLVVVVAIKGGTTPSKLLMPLAFAAHAGSMLALTGTPVNIIVSEAAYEALGRHFGFFEFALVGLPLVAGTTLLIVALSDRLLPQFHCQIRYPFRSQDSCRTSCEVTPQHR